MAAGTHPTIEHLAAISVATHVPFEWLATGRGNSGHSPQVEIPAIAVDYTLDEREARLLEVVRRLPKNKRQAICALFELIAG